MTRLDRRYEERRDDLDRLNSLARSCGCTSSALALLLSLAASSYYFLHATAASYAVWERALYVLLSTLGGALVGKIAGIGLARIRYRVLKKRIETVELASSLKSS
jgi:hypothetical protein